MPRTWLALFFGYNGTNFYGMQYQKQQHIRTIENQLMRILKQKQLISTQSHYCLEKQYKWSRAARTDKGVHAAINGISAWFFIPQQFYDQDQTLNCQKLDKQFADMFQDTQITYHTFKRVTPRFEMRSFVKARVYCYICPLSYFKSEQLSRQEVLAKINRCCQKFIGSKNFHNYSRGIKAKDPQAMRYIMDFSCQSFNQGMVRFTIKGQSFIYHQIRKIIGAIIFIFENEYQVEFLGNTFFRNQLPLPLAPPFGLFLNGLVFDSYNRKKDIPEQITFKQKSIDELRDELEKAILNTESQKWDQWLKLLRQNALIKIDQQQDKEAFDDS